MNIEENVNQAELDAEQTAEDINILKKVRIEKFDNLKAEGKNPYEITKYDVTNLNSELIKKYEEQEAEVVITSYSIHYTKLYEFQHIYLLKPCRQP